MEKHKAFLLLMIIQILFVNSCILSYFDDNKAAMIVPASELLVDISSFPDGWSSTFCDSSLCDEDGGINTAGQDYYVKGEEGHVFEEVYRLRNEKEALKLFISYFKGETQKSEVREPFVEYSNPIEVPFESKFAETSSFVCGVDVIPNCQ